MLAVHLFLSLSLISVTSAVDVLKPLALYNSSHAIEGVLSPLAEDHSLDPQHLAFALDLQDEELLMHAGEKMPSNDFTLAMMNIETSEVQKIINMQRFTTLLSDVKCGEPFTTITFQSRSAFEYAANAWDWVNSHPDHVIQMVPFWKDCFCAQGSYRPFRFHKIEVDSGRLTILLEGIELEWEHAMHAFDIHVTTAIDDGDTFIAPSSMLLEIPDDFTTVEQPPSNHSTFDDEKIHLSGPKWLRRAVGWLQGIHINVKKGHSVYLQHQVPAWTKVADVNDLRKGHGGILFGVQCISCHSSGRLDFAVDIRWSLAHGVENFGASATAVGIVIVSVLQSKLSGQSTLTLDYSRTLFEFPIPGFGCSIPHVFTAGFIAKLKFGVSLARWTGSMSLVHGVALTIPDYSRIYVDLVHSNEGHHTSFTPQIRFRQPELKGNANGVVSTFLAAGVGLELKLFKLPSYDMGLGLKAPVFKIHVEFHKTWAPPCRTNHPSLAIDVSVGFALGWKIGKSGDFSVTLPIGKRAMLDGRADGQEEPRIPPALISTPVGIELSQAQDYLDFVMDEPAHTASAGLDKRGTGFSFGMTIFDYYIPVIKNLCIWVNNGRRGLALEQQKTPRKSIAL
ncbi:BQ2448_1833 [Microbotryum intermedium]|uniref:BQ2448_1833 protein n=1 Tax=Microbotryum intermedium TaxID=269621 RepID=A0A238FCC9_9BASI|nr:BQ2448_1833 [Microbotryum intermedium]